MKNFILLIGIAFLLLQLVGEQDSESYRRVNNINEIHNSYVVQK